jgi:hypothetical protein
VDSIFGVALPVRPKRSATTVANGYTVEEPTIEIVSRAIAVPGTLAMARAAAAPAKVAFILKFTVKPPSYMAPALVR